MPEDRRENGEETPEEEESQDKAFEFGSDEASSGGPESTDSGLGNLPPLSDFESSSISDSDTSLPPLGDLSSDSGLETESGLPPLSEISVETPTPSGGAVKPPPPGYEKRGDSAFDTPLSEGDLDTPRPPDDSTSFQDLGGDSDFSPQTPEIGPGPESDVDTPMFDSAFGASESDFATPSDTPAPTQAMETPMFGIDQGIGESPPAFAESPVEPGAGFDAGTPIPDFSPDTGVPALEETPAGPPEKRKAKAAGVSILVTVIVGIVAFLIGLGAGPWLPFMPSPLGGKLKDAQEQLRLANARIRKFEEASVRPGEGGVTQEDLDKRIAEFKRLEGELSKLETRSAELDGDIRDKQQQLELTQADLEAVTEEYVKGDEMLSELRNDLAITEARHEGLRAENQRLVNLTGSLEQANARRMATKEALENAIDKLIIQVREGIPLTPDKYAYEGRVAAVDALRAKVSRARWVTPELLREYTDLYLAELEIAASTQYFFARIPLNHSFGGSEMMWAECLMNGNSSVYFQTIDGKYAGIYENVADKGLPKYEFRQFLPDALDAQVREAVVSARPESYEDALTVIKARKEARSDKSNLQKSFESL
ncbi:MAG TPA: hypothetical protein HPP77_09080 [Candidatus Hydrogenedentes bacterium]|nr:hypothetical protein [Candidatus Hydrogenedentota bacterium]HIJ73170.1 hypothetical protein [Candidatus Hydrogenedentota bacterium]